jgi:prepilin signal peptidase PulO-like enzyme (type II secretory pathway)
MLGLMLLVGMVLVILQLWFRHNTKDDEYTRSLRLSGLERGLAVVFLVTIATAVWGTLSDNPALRQGAIGALLAILMLNLSELFYAWWRLRR